jgi:hypothetical protein
LNTDASDAGVNTLIIIEIKIIYAGGTGILSTLAGLACTITSFTDYTTFYCTSRTGIVTDSSIEKLNRPCSCGVFAGFAE